MREVTFDRFYVEKEQFDLYNEIEDREDTVFKYHPELFLLAAVVGYKYNLYKPLTTRKQLVQKSAIFNVENADLIYEAFKIISRKKGEIDDEGNIKINAVMENYANGGFTKIYNDILIQRQSEVEDLVNYLMLRF